MDESERDECKKKKKRRKKKGTRKKYTHTHSRMSPVVIGFVHSHLSFRSAFFFFFVLLVVSNEEIKRKSHSF